MNWGEIRLNDVHYEGWKHGPVIRDTTRTKNMVRGWDIDAMLHGVRRTWSELEPEPKYYTYSSAYNSSFVLIPIHSNTCFDQQASKPAHTQQNSPSSSLTGFNSSKYA